MASKGNANRWTLDDRMKEYEAVTTNRMLMSRVPVYARIDGRCFHSFCRGLEKPFDQAFVEVMQKVCAYIVEETNAALGYVESDELSFVWTEASKVPFETRLFKLESTLAGMATSAFTLFGLKTKLKDKIERMMPHFDCRVCNLPNLDEAANMILFREQDCLKNSITMVALSRYSHNMLQGKNSVDKIRMLADVGIIYEHDIAEHLRLGSYYRRELYEKALSDEELARVPEKQRKLDENGKMVVTRSHVVQFRLGSPLHSIKNKADVLFNAAAPILFDDMTNERN